MILRWQRLGKKIGVSSAAIIGAVTLGAVAMAMADPYQFTANLPWYGGPYDSPMSLNTTTSSPSVKVGTISPSSQNNGAVYVDVKGYYGNVVGNSKAAYSGHTYTWHNILPVHYYGEYIQMGSYTGNLTSITVTGNSWHW